MREYTGHERWLWPSYAQCFDAQRRFVGYACTLCPAVGNRVGIVHCPLCPLWSPSNLDGFVPSYPVPEPEPSPMTERLNRGREFGR